MISAHAPFALSLSKGKIWFVQQAQKQGIFKDDKFTYNKESDTYSCSAGNILKRKSLHTNRQGIDYGASKKACLACGLREQCTRNKSGRTVKRHLRQAELEIMRKASNSAASRQDIRTRQHLMERSFARGTRYGFDRARWRNLWRVKIQEYLTCAIQNIQVLVKHGSRPKKSVAMAMEVVKQEAVMVINRSLKLIEPLLNNFRFQLLPV